MTLHPPAPIIWTRDRFQDRGLLLGSVGYPELAEGPRSVGKVFTCHLLDWGSSLPEDLIPYEVALRIKPPI